MNSKGRDCMSAKTSVELGETSKLLTDTEREARGRHGTPNANMVSPNMEPLHRLVERHAALLAQFARYAINDYLNNRRDGLEGMLWVQDSNEPLEQSRKRVATAVLQLFATWEKSGKPPTYDGAPFATSIVEQEMKR